jgi:glutaredoxin
VAQKYGVFRSEGHSERAIFVVDKEGIIRYIDIHDIDDQPDNEVVRQELLKITPASDITKIKHATKEIVELPHDGITLYCTPWCHECKTARKWLHDRSLEFSDVDITKTFGAAQQVMDWADGNRTTPTFDVAGVIVVGWDEVALKDALKAKGYLD